MGSKFHKSEVATAAPLLTTPCEQGKPCPFRDKEMRDGELIQFAEPRPIEECGNLAVTQVMFGDDATKQRLLASECPVEAQYPNIRATIEAEGAQANA